MVLSFPVKDDDKVVSIPAVVPGSAEIVNLVTLSQAAYDALATKDAKTLYVVTPNPS
jgi:hypothetical protein